MDTAASKKGLVSAMIAHREGLKMLKRADGLARIVLRMKVERDTTKKGIFLDRRA